MSTAPPRRRSARTAMSSPPSGRYPTQLGDCPGVTRHAWSARQARRRGEPRRSAPLRGRGGGAVDRGPPRRRLSGGAGRLPSEDITVHGLDGGAGLLGACGGLRRGCRSSPSSTVFRASASSSVRTSSMDRGDPRALSGTGEGRRYGAERVLYPSVNPAGAEPRFFHCGHEVRGSDQPPASAPCDRFGFGSS